jgi:hypothetical protein
MEAGSADPGTQPMCELLWMCRICVCECEPCEPKQNGPVPHKLAALCILDCMMKERSRRYLNLLPYCRLETLLGVLAKDYHEQVWYG